jgi:hypothetical protein
MDAEPVAALVQQPPVSDLTDERMDAEPAAAPVQQPPAPFPVQGKGKETVSRVPRQGRKRKRDDGDQTFRDPKELTAQMLVQQVSCNTLAYRMIHIGRFPVIRLGHKLSKLTELSLFSTLAITNLYVCAIARLRHSMSRPLLSHRSAAILDMENFTLGSILRWFKTR